MALGGGYDASAPVRRQGPLGNVVPRRPSDETPMPVVEGDGAPGDSGDFSDSEHDHPFALSDAVPALVVPGGSGSTAGSLPAREGHAHGVPISALTPAAVVDGPGAPGGTGELPDAGHQHPLDLEALTAGLAPSPHDNAHHSEAYATETALTAHEGNTTTAHGASVSPAPNTIGRRTPDGQMEVAPSTAGTHAVANSETSVTAAVGTIARRGPFGTIDAQGPFADEHAVNRGTADLRYVRTAGGTMTGPLQVPAGSAAAPGLAVGEDDTGLSGAADRLDLVTGGVSRVQAGVAGLRPTTDGLPLGLSGQRWGDVHSDGVIETNAAPVGGPAIHAPNGAIEGADFVTDGSLFADSAAFGMRSAQHVAVTGGTGAGQGIVMGVKSGGNLRVLEEAGFSERPVLASAYNTPSDARSKREIEPNTHDDLDDVLRRMPTSRYRRLYRSPIRPKGADPRSEPTGVRETLGDVELGWLAHDLTPDVVELFGSEEEGWYPGLSLSAMVAKLWHAFQQEHDALTARLEALESA